ncbi:MAG: N-acetyltransferase family protein [Acidobacteria bacterium]|nr:N-acetyltransferase family protein [Acidobacteriota bacterium]
MTFTIEEMSPHDWERVCAIYLEGVATGQATFETEAPAWEDWDAAHLRFARLVARADGAGNADDKVLGWAALAPVSRRRVYAGVAEVSVYVARRARGEGVGAALLAALVEESERSGVWTLQAGIFPENTASLALHRRAEFREVGRRERIGQLEGRWRDTILLERRSGRVGTD